MITNVMIILVKLDLNMFRKSMILIAPDNAGLKFLNCLVLIADILSKFEVFGVFL